MEQNALRRSFRRFVLIVLLLWTQCVCSFAQDIDGDLLLTPTRVVDIRITLPAADWNRLRRKRRRFSAVLSGGTGQSPYKYVSGDITIDGERIESVGIRKKGTFGSLDRERPSLKIKFDEFRKQDPIKGLSRLTLNNNKQDAAQVSQFLTYRLFRDAGLHAPRSSFARVTVNDEYLGIYSHVESIKKPFLERSFGDKSGNLYEGTYAEFLPSSVQKLEAKTNKTGNDRRQIIKLAAALAADGDLSIADVEQVVDIDNFLHFWAMEGLLQMDDSFSSHRSNYYFYENPMNGLGYFIPWGADESFAKKVEPRPTVVYLQSLLANRLYRTEGMPQRYKNTMLHLLDEVWKEAELIAEIDRVEELIRPHLHERQQGTFKAMNDVREFIRTRRKVIQDELSDWPGNAPQIPRAFRAFRP